jgi:hypothetical protein
MRLKVCFCYISSRPQSQPTFRPVPPLRLSLRLPPLQVLTILTMVCSGAKRGLVFFVGIARQKPQ